MDAYTEGNRAIWDAWVARDLESEHHKDVARFRATGSSLRPIERADLGDVAGKSLLHLLCNMGGETLSWARLGARVTGVDFAPAAVARAEALAAEAGLAARFVCANIYELPDRLGDERFDVVFASYGVLFWLGDLEGFARIVADRLNPGGVFYLLDMHPAGNALGLDERDPEGRTFHFEGPYFHDTKPTLERVRISAEGGAAEERSLAIWRYGLGEVVSAMIRAGLRLDFLREHPVINYRRYPTLVHGDDGYWRWPAGSCDLPLLFSLRATKD